MTADGRVSHLIDRVAALESQMAAFGSPLAPSIADAGVVVNDAGTAFIQALLADKNLDPAAAIAQSKISGLTAALATKASSTHAAAHEFGGTDEYIGWFMEGGATREYLHLPREVAMIQKFQGTTGDAVYTYFRARRDYTFTKLGALVVTPSSGSPTLQRLGLYTVDSTTSWNITPVCHTDNVTTLFSATGIQESALVSKNLDGSAGTWPTTYSLVRGNYYALGYCVVGGTIPFMAGPGQLTGTAAQQKPPLAMKLLSQTDIGAATTFASLGGAGQMICGTAAA